jgi:hypothetical protein
VSVVRQQEDLLTRIRDLERQVRELRRGSLFGAAISQGSMEVRTPDGDVIARIGEIEVGGQAAYGMQVFRRNGTLQARFFDTPGGGGYWAMFDEQNTVILSNDTVSGQGLATPYIPLSVMPYSEVLSPSVAVASSSFTITHRVHGQRQHPRVRLLLLLDTDADTTAEVILAQAGVQVSPTMSVPAGNNSYEWLDSTIPGPHLGALFLDVQARVTAGTGQIRIGVGWCAGVQS